MTSPPELVLLIDADNTLIDNDHVAADLRERSTLELGADGAARYWAHFEDLRSELGYADYLGALQRCRLDAQPEVSSLPLLRLSTFLVEYPFASRLYPHALAVVAHLGTLGSTVILSDGDVVFQVHKLRRSGLWDAVCGRVLIYIHKEQSLDAMQRAHPAQHYVMVDDKLRVLSAMKQVLQDRLTTVFVRQGHYALDPAVIAAHPAADRLVERIGDLMDVGPQTFAARHGP